MLVQFCEFAYDCAQLQYIITFCLILQTVITPQMYSIEGRRSDKQKLGDDKVLTDRSSTAALLTQVHKITKRNNVTELTFESFSKSLSSAASVRHLLSESPMSCIAVS